MTTIAGKTDLLLLGEAAAIARAPVSTIRYWAYQGRLATVKVGRRRLIRRSDLEAFIEAGASRRTTNAAGR